MKRIASLIVFTLALAAWALPAAAQDRGPQAPPIPGDPAHTAMHEYQIVLATRGPHWVKPGSLEGRDLRMETINAISRAGDDGLVAAWGMIDDDTPFEFMVVLDLQTKEDALNAIDQAPGFRDGVFKADVHSWYATDLD